MGEINFFVGRIFTSVVWSKELSRKRREGPWFGLYSLYLERMCDANVQMHLLKHTNRHMPCMSSITVIP